MKKPFEKGERVTVYSTCYGAPLVTKGTIEAIAQGLLNVQFDAKSEIGNTGCWAHPRQCRRLIKKPRRRIWVGFKGCDSFPVFFTEEDEDFYPVFFTEEDAALHGWTLGENLFEFIEVRRPK